MLLNEKALALSVSVSKKAATPPGPGRSVWRPAYTWREEKRGTLHIYQKQCSPCSPGRLLQLLLGCPVLTKEFR